MSTDKCSVSEVGPSSISLSLLHQQSVLGQYHLLWLLPLCKQHVAPHLENFLQCSFLRWHTASLQFLVMPVLLARIWCPQQLLLLLDPACDYMDAFIWSKRTLFIQGIFQLSFQIFNAFLRVFFFIYIPDRITWKKLTFPYCLVLIFFLTSCIYWLGVQHLCPLLEF